MEVVTSSIGGNPSKRETVSSTSIPNTGGNPINSTQQASRDSQSSTNHRRRYTGSSIPLRPEGPLPPIINNNVFASVTAPTIIGGGFDSVDRFRMNMGYPGYNGQPQRQGRSTGLRHSSPSNHQRRQSRSTDRNVFQHEPQGGFQSTTWGGGNPVRMSHNSLGPRHSIANFQSNMALEPMLAAPSSRPAYRSQRSSNNLSTSMPSTPRHPRTRQEAGKSRSPSPPLLVLDSPRSAASDPSGHPTLIKSRCPFESGFVMARRRIPYSIGSEPLPNEIPPKEKLSQEEETLLTSDMEQLYNALIPSPEAEDRRKQFLTKLERLLNDEWPGQDIKVRPFGSTESKTSSTDSDIDVCIVTTFKPLDNVCLLSKALAKHKMERISCVHAKVPIVRIWDPEFKVQCDLNVNNVLALENTRMVKTYVDIDSRVRPLAMIVKHWTKQRILNDAAGGGTISSYTWMCMMINFLQTRHPPILPALHQREHKKVSLVNGVDVSFDDDIEKLQGFGEINHESLGGLLFAFFKRYGYEIDFEKKVMSVRAGQLLSKTQKKWDILLGNRLCVEEPFNTSRNLSNGADDSAVRGIHEEFRRAFKMLAESSPNLATCCEEYVFPKEEQTGGTDFVKPASKPVQMTRSNSVGKNRSAPSSDAGGRARSRQFGTYHTPRSSQFNSRRASSGSAFANLPAISSHLMQPAEPYYLVQNSDGSYAYASLSSLQKPLSDAQQNQRQSQLSRQAAIQSLAQAQVAQVIASGSSQNQDQFGQGQDNSSKQQAQNHLLATQNSLSTLNLGYPYLLYPPLMYYPQGVLADPYSINLNNTITQGSMDQRLNRTKVLPGGPRSRSQPAPHLEPSNRPIPAIPIPADSTADFRDLVGGNESVTSASNASDHSTNPADMATGDNSFGDEEYYGYMYPEQAPITGPSPDLFVNQKDIVDQQRRLSKEKIIIPKFSDHPRASQPPSPIKTINHSKFIQSQDQVWSSSDGDGERSISQDSFDEEPRPRGPVIVNGSASSVPVTPPFDNNESPRLSLNSDSPRADVMFHHGSTGYQDTLGEHVLDPVYSHQGYANSSGHEDISSLPKTAYAINPYTGQPMTFAQYPPYASGYPIMTSQMFDPQAQNSKQRSSVQYGRQYDVEQVINTSKYANQVQPHLDLATPSHGLNGRDSRSAQISNKYRSGASHISVGDVSEDTKQHGAQVLTKWQTSPSPPQESSIKIGRNKQGASSNSGTDNSEDDATLTARSFGNNNQKNKINGTIRASAKVLDAIQAITKSTSTVTHSSLTNGLKSNGAMSKLEDSPFPSSQAHSNKAKEWNKPKGRKNNGKKKKSHSAADNSTVGEERKGG